MTKYEELMFRLGMSSNKGMLYLKTIFNLAEKEPEILNDNMVNNYKRVADMYEVTWKSVERVIRVSLEKLEDRKSPLKKQIFGAIEKIRVKNFIKTIYSYCNREVGIRFGDFLGLYDGDDVEIVVYNKSDDDDENIILRDEYNFNSDRYVDSYYVDTFNKKLNIILS